MVAKCIRQRHAAAHFLMHILEHRFEQGVRDLRPQQIERLHQRHAGLQQRGELLIEDQKLVFRNPPALWKPLDAAEQASLAQRQHMQTLILELVPEPRLALRRVRALDDLARRRNQPAAKFHAKCLEIIALRGFSRDSPEGSAMCKPCTSRHEIACDGT